MPNKHVYFTLGAMHGAILVVWIHCKRKKWFEEYRWMRKIYKWNADWSLYLPLAIGCFGCLGLIPDVLLMLNAVPKEIVRSDLFNVFYGYSWFERIEDVHPEIDCLINRVGSLILYMLALGMLTIYALKLLALINDDR